MLNEVESTQCKVRRKSVKKVPVKLNSDAISTPQNLVYLMRHKLPDCLPFCHLLARLCYNFPLGNKFFRSVFFLISSLRSLWLRDLTVRERMCHAMASWREKYVKVLVVESGKLLLMTGKNEEETSVNITEWKITHFTFCSLFSKHGEHFFVL